jgi:hypothetical protein
MQPISRMNRTAWAAGPDGIGVVFPGESPDSTYRNKNLASYASSGKTTGRDEVIDRTNAQAECFGSVTPGIEQLFYRSIHAQSPLLSVKSAFKQISIKDYESPGQSDRVAGIRSGNATWLTSFTRDCTENSLASKTFFVKIDAGKASVGRIQSPAGIEGSNEARWESFSANS